MLPYHLCSVNGIPVPFDEVPITQEVATGAEAVFRCRHSTADIIRWRVNGSLVGWYPPPDITPDTTRDDNGNLVDLLTITAQPQYSGTEVVCVARFDDGRPEELSQPAILIGTARIQPRCNPTGSYTEKSMLCDAHR